MFCLDLVAGWKQIKNKSCSENGTIVFCLVLKINKISKISRGWEVSCILRSVKRTKCFCFRNNCVRKRQKDKIKNYSVWQTTLYLHVAVKKTKETSYFFLVLASTGLELFFVVWRLIFFQIQQTISIQKTQHSHGNTKTSEFSSLLKMLN